MFSADSDLTLREGRSVSESQGESAKEAEREERREEDALVQVLEEEARRVEVRRRQLVQDALDCLQALVAFGELCGREGERASESQTRSVRTRKPRGDDDAPAAATKSSCRSCVMRGTGSERK